MRFCKGPNWCNHPMGRPSMDDTDSIHIHCRVRIGIHRIKIQRPIFCACSEWLREGSFWPGLGSRQQQHRTRLPGFIPLNDGFPCPCIWRADSKLPCGNPLKHTEQLERRQVHYSWNNNNNNNNSCYSCHMHIQPRGGTAWSPSCQRPRFVGLLVVRLRTRWRWKS
jgi:hypothetical protein